MELPRHLLTVWNPSYGTDVMESHIRILRELAQRFRDGGDEEEVYVWWGKIRSVATRLGSVPRPVLRSSVSRDMSRAAIITRDRKGDAWMGRVVLVGSK